MSKVKLAKAVYKDQVICQEVELADNFFRRFMGLMYRKSMPQTHGLLLDPCNQIHTFGMRFDIDTVVMDKENNIIFLDRDIKPGKIRPFVKNGQKILELNAGIIEKYDLQTGNKISIMVLGK